MPTADLHGLRILVTRPAHQAGPLCELVQQAGGVPIAYPALEILPPSDPAPAQPIIAHLADYRIAIFISPNAVERGLELMCRHAPLPASLQLACVGKGSARALQQRLGRAPAIFPEGRYDSEALLALPELQDVAGKRLLIVRGEGGRELLASTLRERGAQVDYLEVYRRSAPQNPPAWPQEVDIITVTSSEGLENLLAIARAQQRDILDLPLVTVSERTAELARHRGFRHPAIIAENASDAALLDALRHWLRGHQENGITHE